MTTNKKPGVERPDRGGKEGLINTIISDPISQDLRRQATELAAILIDLYQRYQ